MGKLNNRDIEREFLLAFWKILILHQAEQKPVVGQWIISSLRQHGHEVSSGTVYPLLKRMEERGWLKCVVAPGGGLRARREHSLTKAGRQILALLRNEVSELHREVVLGEPESASRNSP